jgi:hypothetical protein
VKGKNGNNVKLMVGEDPETIDEYINDRLHSEVKKHHKIRFNCYKKWCELFCLNCWFNCGAKQSQAKLLKKG